MGKIRISEVRTPGDLDRTIQAITGQPSGITWCAVCGDREANGRNSASDPVCGDCKNT